MEKLTEERKHFETLGLSYPSNASVKIQKQVIAGVDCYLFTPESINSSEIVIHLHGGGFIYGSIESHRAMTSHLTAATGRKFLFIEYALAPEKPFPNALNEIEAVIQSLLDENPKLKFALLGDSCGGNLVMSTVLNLKKQNKQLPLYQVLISPWLNLETTYESYAENEKLDPILTKPFIQYAASLYTGLENFANPLVSPVLGKFEGINPTLTLVGAREILRDDSVHLNKALKSSGCESSLKIFDDVTHVWTLTNITSTDSTTALNDIRQFVDQVTNNRYEPSLVSR